MRKLLLIVVGVLLVLGVASNAMAAPFTSTGWVDPNYGNTWNSQTLSGTARYFFYWDNPSVTVNEVDIQFEGDIFNLSVLDATDFTVVAPDGWNTALYTETSGVYHWSLSSGDGITSADDPIIVDVNYTLLSESRYYYGNNVFAGEAELWNWLEAQGVNSPWSQKYELAFKVDVPGYGRLTVDSSGGSTAPVPEPATMALLGMGVLGLVGLKRKA